MPVGIKPLHLSYWKAIPNYRIHTARGVILLAFLVFACLLPVARAATKVVTDADKDNMVHLKVGDTLEVRLKANPSTGYMWYITKESTPLMKLVHQTQTDAAEPGVGRPVVQVFIFEPRQSGRRHTAAALRPLLGTAHAER